MKQVKRNGMKQHRYDYDITDHETGRETYARTIDYLGLDGLDKKIFYFMHEHSIDSLTVNNGVMKNVEYTISKAT